MFSGLTTEVALIKIGLSGLKPTGAEKYFYLQKVWEQEKVQSFQNFLHRYKSNEIVPTLEAMQEMVEFSNIKCSDMFKLG